MSFASDISAVTKTTSAGIQAINGRTRVQGIYFLASDTAGTINLHDGEDGQAPLLLSLASAGDDASTDVILPDAGILFKNGVFLDFDEAVSVTLFFYGGAVAPDPDPPPP